jgi:hypothetical protein
VTETYSVRDTGGELGMLLAAVATPPTGRDHAHEQNTLATRRGRFIGLRSLFRSPDEFAHVHNRVPTPVAIASFGLHRQFTTSIVRVGEPV